jgi:hypothetical protein
MLTSCDNKGLCKAVSLSQNVMKYTYGAPDGFCFMAFVLTLLLHQYCHFQKID